MITIDPYTPEGSSSSYRLGFIVKGHADYATRGQDIVCAGVSAIAQTALLGLDHYNPIKVLQREGYLRVIVESDDHTSDAIIKTMLLGLHELQRQYPEYIQIRETGETM